MTTSQHPTKTSGAQNKMDFFPNVILQFVMARDAIAGGPFDVRIELVMDRRHRLCRL